MTIKPYDNQESATTAPYDFQRENSAGIDKACGAGLLLRTANL
jgi:hypothetical protein